VNKHVLECLFEKNSFVIDLMQKTIQNSMEKLEVNLVNRINTLNDRIDALAYEIDELGQAIHPEHVVQEEVNGDDDEGVMKSQKNWRKMVRFTLILLMKVVMKVMVMMMVKYCL